MITVMSDCNNIILYSTSQNSVYPKNDQTYPWSLDGFGVNVLLPFNIGGCIYHPWSRNHG